MLLAIFYQGVAILVIGEVVIFELCTDAWEVLAHVWHVALLTGMIEGLLLSVEIRHAFTTNSACKHILMSVYQRIYPFLSKSINKSLNIINVTHIVCVRYSFNCLPHDAKSHEVEPPLLEVPYFGVGQGKFRVKGIS